MLDPISGRQVERAVCQHPGCNKTFSQKSDAKRHYLNVHQGRKFACEICSKTFSSREMVRAHTQNVHENKRWECTQCAKVFRWQRNIIKHKCRGQPLIKKHKCPYCKRAYAHVSGLSRHKRTCKRDTWAYARYMCVCEIKWIQKEICILSSCCFRPPSLPYHFPCHLINTPKQFIYIINLLLLAIL
jgi:uncharacterized Zn-finger protein